METHVLTGRGEHLEIGTVGETTHLAHVARQVAQLRLSGWDSRHVVGGGAGRRAHHEALLLHGLVEARRVQRVAVDHVVLSRSKHDVVALPITPTPHAHRRHSEHGGARVEDAKTCGLLRVEHAHVEVRRRGHHEALLRVTPTPSAHGVCHHLVHAVGVAHELLRQLRHADIL